jgi:hypothetical protein
MAVGSCPAASRLALGVAAQDSTTTTALAPVCAPCHAAQAKMTERNFHQVRREVRLMTIIECVSGRCMAVAALRRVRACAHVHGRAVQAGVATPACTLQCVKHHMQTPRSPA